ncbi:hypothetical protein DFH06DRAFT_1096919 [Mycena polygramma]|nr:hypothetical protein DFH06DRAFT_1096919 [Mycena polygramma]
MDPSKFNIPDNEMPNQGILRPITSYSTNRYENKALVDTFAMGISPGLFTKSREPEPEYLAPLWSGHVHPEGQLYFFHDGPLRVVTEANIHCPDTMENVGRWIKHIEALLSDVEIQISEDFELFVEIDGENCAYYFVDHATCAQFWLESSDTDRLGLQQVSSASQLKIMLEELYWVHVEHFPMHLPALPVQKLDELISVFNHGLCDQMTSRTSTFSYTAEKCTVFLSVLQGCKANLNNGHTTWIIARLWSVIDHNKCLTNYGEEHARLSRDQYILYDPEQKYRWISCIAACLTFKTSDLHLARLDDVFVDHMVYADRWEALIGNCLKEWRGSAAGAFAGLVLHLPFLASSSASPALLTASAALYISALGASILLDHVYVSMEGLGADDARDYLESIQSPVFKFQFVAFTFSLPKALQLWGSLILLGNCLYVVFNYFGWRAAVGLAALAALVILMLHGITSATVQESCARSMRIFCRDREEAGIQMV